MENKPSRIPTTRIIMTIPVQLLDELDKAAEALRFSRTRLILRSLKREMATTLKRETLRAKAYADDMSKSFGHWV